MANTTDISTTNPIFSLGEDFTDVGFCDLWSYYPTGETFAVVLPYASICASTSSNSLEEATFFLQGTMYFGLIFLLIVMVQSMARNRIDWYRLLAFYLVGTIGVPVSNALGTSAPGFNRFIGFGVLVHNMAEAAILAVIWRGTKQQSSLGVRLMIVYFWIMLNLITFLDLHVLLWAASFQGATLDFFLVTSFCTVALSFDKRGKYFWISAAAAILHILTIQPLFLGMALGWTALSVPTVLFLVPTFMLYIWFASSDPRANLSLAQSRALTEQYELEEKRKESIVQATAIAIKRIQSQSMELQQRLSVKKLEMQNANSDRSNSGNETNKENFRKLNDSGDNNSNNNSKRAQFATDIIPDAVGTPVDDNNNDKKEDNNNNNNETMKDLANDTVIELESKNKNKKEENNNNNNNNNKQSSSKENSKDGAMVEEDDIEAEHAFDDENYKGHSGQTIREEYDTVEHVITQGLFHSAHIKDPMKLFKRALFIALVGSISDVVFLITSPCWIDTSFLCDD